MKHALIAASLALSPLAVFGAIKIEPIPDLRPPRPELPETALQNSPAPLILGWLAVAGLAVAFTWPRRRSALPPPSPYAVAQGELEALRAEDALATPAAVSSVVRRYVVEVSGLPGLGVTSDEVSTVLAAQNFCTAELQDATSRLLHECDVAVFAPEAPAGTPLEFVSRAEKLLADLEARRPTPVSVP